MNVKEHKKEERACIIRALISQSFIKDDFYIEPFGTIKLDPCLGLVGFMEVIRNSWIKKRLDGNKLNEVSKECIYELTVYSFMALGGKPISFEDSVKQYSFITEMDYDPKVIERKYYIYHKRIDSILKGSSMIECLFIRFSDGFHKLLVCDKHIYKVREEDFKLAMERPGV